MLGFHTASLFGPTYDRVFDGVVPPRTGAVSVINRVSCMCCEPGRAARLVHLAGASRVADGLDRCPGVPGGSKMTCLYVTPVCTTRVDVRARIWRSALVARQIRPGKKKMMRVILSEEEKYMGEGSWSRWGGGSDGAPSLYPAP